MHRFVSTQERRNLNMKKRNLLIALILILLYALCIEEYRPYEVLHSTVLSSPNLTEHKITLVVHSILPIDHDRLAKEIVDEYLQMNEGQPNPYFELKLYRTRLHYRLNILYDTLLCDKEGRLVPEIILAKFRRYCMIKYSKSIVMMKGIPPCSSYSHPH